jgi:hypothetical protein
VLLLILTINAAATTATAAAATITAATTTATAATVPTAANALVVELLLCSVFVQSKHAL